MLLVAAAVLVASAWLRGAEYDEQYTLFLTGGTARPVWPDSVFTAGEAKALQSGHAGLFAIAHDLRATDVHPPLYFWAVALWRRLVGGGLFATRLFSVLCSVATLAIVAAIARRAAVPVAAAMLLTLGCYGFVYTGLVARGFALAQLLSVAGVAVLLLAQARPRLALWAGLLLGAATFANYLAVFVGCAALAWWRLLSREAGGWAVWIGFALWLPADVFFFLAQRHSRVGQFVPLDLASGIARLARYSAANVFGGLPLYVSGTASHIVAWALSALLLLLVALVVARWRRMHPLFALAAIAPPVGLLLLGVAFNNTPIELRYLAFATPFIGLLLASALPRRLVYVVLAVQTLSLAGLMTRPETMQPARGTAIAASALAQDGVVLLPRGNDGVGIVGAFAIESAPALRLLVIPRDEPPAQIRAHAEHYPRVVLALLDQDADSHATLSHMREAFAEPCWRVAGEGFNVLAFDRICGEK